jgi:5-deoxy-glucuronate isomerase
MTPTGLPVDLHTRLLRDNATDTGLRPNHETVLVLLGGRATVTVDDGPRWTDIGTRRDVFDGPATACYLPAGLRWHITADAGGVAYAVITCPASTAGEPYLVTPEQVVTQRRGRGAFARDVHDIISPHHRAEALLVGETFNAGDGVWSSYPPHKHDHHDPPYESAQREAFLVKVHPDTGYGLFMHYRTADDPRQTTVVYDGDVITVEDGYHSFVAAAGHKFYYLWALGGTERTLHFNTDPRHRWLLEPDGSL